MFDEQKYIQVISEYRETAQKIKELDEKKDLIRQKIAELLHQDQKNEIDVKLENGENWHSGYQTTSRTNTDLKLLLEYVGPTKYNEIVTEKSTTFLTVRKAGKSKESKILTEKPVSNEPIQPIIPAGTILS